MSSLLAANIGNTRISLGVFELPVRAPVPEPRSAASFPWPPDETFAPDFSPPQQPKFAVIASVSPARREAVAAWIRERFGIDPLDFPRDVRPGLANRCQPPESVGADRLANAVAAHAELKDASIVVDAGTAVTVDAVSADGSFLGGAILPGAATAAQALARATALLPEVPTPAAGFEIGAAIGTSTTDAITSGVLRGLAGGIDRLIDDISAECGRPRHILITGGDAELIASLCRSPMQARPHLALAGLAIAVTNHFNA